MSVPPVDEFALSCDRPCVAAHSLLQTSAQTHRQTTNCKRQHNEHAVQM